MKQLFTFFIVTILFITKTNSSTAQVNVNDSLALVDLYTSTNGANWYNNSGSITAPVNTWFGITVSGNRVTQIYFDDNNLNGKLPSSIGNLSQLNTFVVDANKITSSIPSSFGKLTQLMNLSMQSCELSGSIPLSWVS